MLPELLDQIPPDQDIASVTADGANDTRKCHDAIAHGAAAIIPPRKNAKPWKQDSAGAVTRNEALRASRRFGRTILRRWSGYHRRSREETKMHCVKLLGQRLTARDFDHQVAEENLGPGQVVPSLECSLAALALDHVDLALIHWPARKGGPAPEVYLRQIAEAKERGLARHIGVSNFTIALVEEARPILGDGAILTNQVELNPWFRNRKLADHCVSRGIIVTCYEPLARGNVGADPVLQRIAKEHDARPEQVALAWELAQGYAAISTSRNLNRIAQNFAAQKLALSPDELAEIDGLDRGIRSIDPAWGPDWD